MKNETSAYGLKHPSGIYTFTIKQVGQQNNFNNNNHKLVSNT